ncbi:unnamed protein product [Lampetra planeri]
MLRGKSQPKKLQRQECGVVPIALPILVERLAGTGGLKIPSRGGGGAWRRRAWRLRHVRAGGRVEVVCRQRAKPPCPVGGTRAEIVHGEMRQSPRRSSGDLDRGIRAP